MLPRTRRLTTRQFDDVWKRGTSVCGAFVCVRILHGTPDVRAAAIAPRKSAVSAVARNRTRRRLYALLRPLLDSIENVWLVVSARAPLATVPVAALADDLSRTLREARTRRPR